MSNIAEKETLVEEYNWNKVIFDQIKNEYWFNTIKRNVEKARSKGDVFPPTNLVFNAFKLCPRHKFKVLILGDQPYHLAGQDHGLAYSTLSLMRPVSLGYIYAEINRSLFENGYNFRSTSNDLTEWAEQGVLLLNNILTVENGKPNSHKKINWEKFIIRTLSATYIHRTPFVVMLWGKELHKYASFWDNSPQKVLVLKAANPGSEAYPGRSNRMRFIGCDHFRLANEFLISNNIEPIDWLIRKQLIL